MTAPTAKHLVIPEGTHHIDLYAYSGADIKTLYLPDSLRTIGMSAFKDCRELTFVSMSPNTYCNYKLSLKQWDGIFSGCVSLTDVELRGTLNDYVWHDADRPELLKGFDPERTFLQCVKMKRLTAREIDPAFIPRQWLTWAVNAFLLDAERETTFCEEAKRFYHGYLSAERDVLLHRAEEDAETAVYEYLMENDMIREDELPRLIDSAQAKANTEATAALLSYRKKRDAAHFLRELELTN